MVPARSDTHPGSSGPCSGRLRSRCAYTCTMSEDTCCSGGGEVGRTAGRESRMAARHASTSPRGSAWQHCKGRVPARRASCRLMMDGGRGKS